MRAGAGLGRRVSAIRRPAGGARWPNAVGALLVVGLSVAASACYSQVTAGYTNGVPDNEGHRGAAFNVHGGVYDRHGGLGANARMRVTDIHTQIGLGLETTSFLPMQPKPFFRLGGSVFEVEWVRDPEVVSISTLSPFAEAGVLFAVDGDSGFTVSLAFEVDLLAAPRLRNYASFLIGWAVATPLRI